MKMKKIVLFMFVVAIISGCKNERTFSENIVFKASLPCADCEQIDQTLTLNRDGSFELNNVYVSQEPSEFMENGTYIIHDDIITTTNSQKEQNFYQISGENLYLLTSQKELPSKELRDYYMFKPVK